MRDELGSSSGVPVLCKFPRNVDLPWELSLEAISKETDAAEGKFGDVVVDQVGRTMAANWFNPVGHIGM
jgi:hypothetical protein